ncbi:MAG: hypothetical protein Q9181_003790 [Wetmoreana brouardii]
MASNNRQAVDEAMSTPSRPRVHFSGETPECPPAPQKDKVEDGHNKQNNSILKLKTGSKAMIQQTGLASQVLSNRLSNTDNSSIHSPIRTFTSSSLTQRNWRNTPEHSFFVGLLRKSDRSFLDRLMQEVLEDRLSSDTLEKGCRFISDGYMASNQPPGRFLPRPLPYSVPSASRSPNQIGAIGGNTPQGPPSLPREPTQASDPVVHQHLLANPHLSEFHSAARGHAIDRTSPANFNLSLASVGPSGPPQGAIDLENLVEPSDPVLDQYLLANPHPSEPHSSARGHATHRTSLASFNLSFASAGPRTPSQGGIDPANLPYQNLGPVYPDVRPYLQENPDVAAFYNAVSSYGTSRTKVIDVDFNSLTDSPASTSHDLHRAPSVFSPAAGTPESVPLLTNIKKRRHPQSGFSISGTADTGFDNSGPHQEPARRSSRGRPRTRYHPSFGHAGIVRSYRPEELESESSSVVHHSTFRTSSTEFNATSRAGISASEPASCCECPELWSTGTTIHNPNSAVDNGEQITHGVPLKPCSNSRAHSDGPHYVCAKCRVHGAKHLAKYFGDLQQQPRRLALCDWCGTNNLNKIAKPEDFEDGVLKWTTCKCDNGGWCFECTLNDLRTAKRKYETELEFRREFTGTFESEGKKFCRIDTLCICGTSLHGAEKRSVSRHDNPLLRSSAQVVPNGM